MTFANLPFPFLLVLVLTKLYYTGGPLVITGASPKNDVLVGLPSLFPYPCGEEGIPDVYTRISAFVEWIEGTLSCFNSTTCTSSPSNSPRPSTSPSVSVNPSVAPTASFSPAASFSPTVAPTPPTPQYLPGPTANIVVSLKTDYYPEDSALWYQNVCNGDLSILFDVGELKMMNSNTSVALSTGIYQFVLFDSYGDGKWCYQAFEVNEFLHYKQRFFSHHNSSHILLYCQELKMVVGL
jgi:hypothetical protein